MKVLFNTSLKILSISIITFSSVATPFPALLVHASSGKLAINTCLDIRAQYPNGVAFNKKVRGLKQFPKAKIDAGIFISNRELDENGNKNGIICDKKESFKEIKAKASVYMTFEGKNIQFFMACSMSQPHLEYGETVGMAGLFFSYSCSQSISNLDPQYSVTVYDYLNSFVVFDHPVTENWYFTDPPPPTKAVFQTSNYHTPFFQVPPNSAMAKVFDSGAWVTGRKLEIESLYQRIQNGLVPNLYLDLHWKDTNGCFTTAQQPPYNDLRVDIDCNVDGYQNEFVWD